LISILFVHRAQQTHYHYTAMSNDTMKAVVFHGPGKVSIEDRPIPQIKEEKDIIVKVDKVRSLCLLLFMANTL
jgi:phosphoribosylformylglycinamidine (FGAM) synthase-like amidotransferase family enzyme